MTGRRTFLKGALGAGVATVGAGGFIAGDKATLSVVGTQEREPVEARVNMHLENGQWKIGAAKIQQVQKATPPRQPVRKAPRKKRAA